jgi:hypothetical protein
MSRPQVGHFLTHRENWEGKATWDGGHDGAKNGRTVAWVSQYVEGSQKGKKTERNEEEIDP